MSEKLLTKLSIKGCDLNTIRGGNIDITNYDVAAALGYGKLSKPAYYFARAKFCEDSQATQCLLEFFKHYVKKSLNSLKLNDTPKVVSGVCELMVSEAVFGIRCKKCQGLGHIKKGASFMDCEKCTGTGTGNLSQRVRAKTVGVPVTTWHRSWNKHLPEFFSYVDLLQDEVKRHIHYQFAA